MGPTLIECIMLLWYASGMDLWRATQLALDCVTCQVKPGFHIFISNKDLFQ